ncbi:metal-dependent hydrolase [Chloroflexota bacterium]
MPEALSMAFTGFSVYNSGRWDRMLIFGHVGITLGTSIALSGLQSILHPHITIQNKAEDPLSSLSKKDRIHNHSMTNNSSFISLVNRIDIRILLVGSLLPDIIDKPIGQWLLKEDFSNGRIFSHTLLFLILITILGVFYYRHFGKTWFLFLSFGTFMHLILDQMWRAPRTLLWPILGLEFDRIDLTDWIGGIWYRLFTDPAVYIPELLGLFVIIWFLWKLLHMRTFYSFARYGRIN